MVTPALVWGANLHGLLATLPALAHMQRCAAGSASWALTDIVSFALFVFGIGTGSLAALLCDPGHWLVRAVFLVARLCTGMVVWGVAAAAVLVEIDPELMWAGAQFAPVVIFSLLCVRVGNGLLAAVGSMLVFSATLVVAATQLILDAEVGALPAEAAGAGPYCHSSSTGALFFVTLLGASYGAGAVGDMPACERSPAYAEWRLATMLRCVVAWSAGGALLAAMRHSDLGARVHDANADSGRGLSGLQYAELAFVALGCAAECCGVACRLWQALEAGARAACGPAPKWKETQLWARKDLTPVQLAELETRLREFEARARFVSVFEPVACVIGGVGFFALVCVSDAYAFEWLAYTHCVAAACALGGLFLTQLRAPEGPAAAVAVVVQDARPEAARPEAASTKARFMLRDLPRAHAPVLLRGRPWGGI
jgi:hypothetical protein